MYEEAQYLSRFKAVNYLELVRPYVKLLANFPRQMNNNEQGKLYTVLYYIW